MNTITFKTTQQYLDDVEKEFNDELISCVPKKQLKLLLNEFDWALSSVKTNINLNLDFSHDTDVNVVFSQKNHLIQLYTHDKNNYLSEEFFLKLLSKIVMLPQMNINKIYTKWFNLISALYSDYFVRLEQKAQERLKELTKITSQNTVLFYNAKNETIATISKDGIFSFKIEPNDENTKDFLKIVQTLGVEIKQINYFEV